MTLRMLTVISCLAFTVLGSVEFNKVKRDRWDDVEENRVVSMCGGVLNYLMGRECSTRGGHASPGKRSGLEVNKFADEHEFERLRRAPHPCCFPGCSKVMLRDYCASADPIQNEVDTD